MTQLILDATEYNVTPPESRKGGYTIESQPLSVDVEMVSGRMVRELRGNVWVIKYQYGYFDDVMKNKVLAACEKGKRTPILCGFLPQESQAELTYSDFIVMSLTRPKFMWSTSGNPLWGDFQVELREVKPHD